MNLFRRRKDDPLSPMSIENQLDRLWTSYLTLRDDVEAQQARQAKFEEFVCSATGRSFEAAEVEGADV